ncbi:MAG: MarC family protein [Flavobacteriales bacterium]|nr:MarC family protein [Flavobacteriales bacterium]
MSFSADLFLLVFTTFITIINPFSLIPVYMTMTASLDAANKRRTAIKASITAFLTMVIFAFAGKFIFDFFGISANGFRIVGGILFFIMGWDMLQARLIRTKMDSETVKEYITDISITPLGIPMICGPGAITNSIILMNDAQDAGAKITVIAAMFVVMLITLVSLFGAAGIQKFLGETGNKVLMRIMGLIVMVIAVEFFFAGLIPILESIQFHFVQG